MKTFFQSFRWAFRGIAIAMRGRNFRVQLVAGLIVITAAATLRVSASDWIKLLMLIGLVLGFEVVNSAIEHLVNFISPGFNPDAGKIKDLAAGAVLLISITAAVAGIVIFWPYLFQK